MNVIRLLSLGIILFIAVTMEVLKRAYGRIFNLQEYIYATLQDAPEKLSKYSQKPG